MEQTTSTTTAPVPPAITAAAAALAAAATTAPEAGAETAGAAQFSALLRAIGFGTVPAPAAHAAAEEEEHAETSEEDAAAATPDTATAAATLVVSAALAVPTQQMLAVPLSIMAHARGTTSGEAAIQPVIIDAVVPAEAGTPGPAPHIPAIPAAPPAAEPVAAIVLPPSPALPQADVDPALVEAAIAAAAETAPARLAAAPATAKPAARVVATAEQATAEAPQPTTLQTTAAQPAKAETTTAPPVRPAEPAAREGGPASGTGQGGRLDLQVQAAPPTRQAAPDTVVETPIQVIDRERVERLADGLAARLKVSHAADGARIRMQLEPRELGEVVVRLEIRNGIAHAHLIAESADASIALHASLADLRSSLADRGLQLDSVSIRVAGEGAGNAREQAGQPQGDRRSRAPFSFGQTEAAGTIAAATDQTDRAREGQSVWMLA